MDDEFGQEEWEIMQEQCDLLYRKRSDQFEAIVKNNACHHYEPLGDFIVGKWFAIVEIIDELGDRNLSIIGSPDIEPWEAMGMASILGMK